MSDAGEPAVPVLTLGGARLPVVGRARMYVCGITPYDTTHIGHAATFVWADVAARVLASTGVDVEVCRNITDVDDDLLAQARAQHLRWRSLATQQTYRFERDMTDLGVGRPTFEPQSHDYVGEVIALAAALLAGGSAYDAGGEVFFVAGDTHRALGLSDDEAVRRAEADGGPAGHPDRRAPLDPVVWQRSASGEPSWPSPWGPGRPGWHASCSAMALSTLGPGIDVHAGGADLAFPHHAYEAAQAEAACGVRPFARSWLRVGNVLAGGQKMAKSTGNLVLVHELLERWSPAVVRLHLLARPWAASWEFDEGDLDATAGRLEELWSRAGTPNARGAADAEVQARLLDDLDVAGALEVGAEAGGRALQGLGRVLALF